MPILSLNIEKLIPHRERMKLINAVLDVNADTVVSSSVVSERWPLCQGSFVDPLVLIEIVAQTAGVHVGWKEGAENGSGKGWLVGIKSADFFLDRIPLHRELITTVKNLYSAENYHVLEGTVMIGTELLGRIQLQVYRGDAD
jgi:predicted hotdog family 3-hydroxylacyl-ACP dehydratase